MNKNMFEHSVKVPRHFKIAANIFKKVSTEGGSIKTLLYDDKLRHYRTNVLYALLTESIKHAAHIDKIFETCGILTKEPRLDPWLAKVLTAELLYGKKILPGKSKPEQTVLSYKDQFEKFSAATQDDSTPKVVPRPRYVRINTNLLTTSDAIRAFQEEGYKFIRCTSGSYNDYLQQIQSLKEYDFTQDYHVKTIFVFAPGTKFHDHVLYLENQIILQDKATAMAVHLLAPPPGSVVLDMCAAPGMKTTQVAAYIKNQGKIYAVERNEERYQTLCDFVEKTGSKCVETLHKDSLEIRRGDFDDVEYIILDPSCSGSGMQLSVHNYVEDVRLAKLTSLQEKFLKHAMNSFPKAKRIVYSTCSLFHEENERVITNIVKASRAKWRVLDVKEMLKGQWNNFGSGMYGSMGTRCLYAKPDSDYTTGFFLAVLDREPKDQGKQSSSEEKKSEKNVGNSESIKDKDNESCQDSQEIRKRKKTKDDSKVTNDFENGISNIDTKSHESLDSDKELKKNRKKRKVETPTMDNTLESTINEKSLVEHIHEPKPKKKKKKDEIPKSEEFATNLLNDDVKNDNIIINLIENDEKFTKKKKKKDKKAGDGESLTNLGLTNEHEIENCPTNSKKKKKKDKKRDVEESSSMEKCETSENVEVSTVEYDRHLNKKKQKKEKLSNTNIGESGSPLNNADLKHTNEDKLSNVINNEAIAVKRKKKDKTKGLGKEASVANEKVAKEDTINFTDVNQNSSCKSKKRKIDLNGSRHLNDDENDVEQNNRKKSKKKKEFEFPQTECINDEISKKKKHKKHSVES